MGRQLFKAIVAVLAGRDKPRTSAARDSRDEDVVKVYSRSVLHDRPTSGARGKKDWPTHLRKRPLLQGPPGRLRPPRRRQGQGVRAACAEWLRRLGGRRAGGAEEQGRAGPGPAAGQGGAGG